MSNIFIQDLHIQALFFIFPETQVMTERRERIDGGEDEEEEEEKKRVLTTKLFYYKSTGFKAVD